MTTGEKVVLVWEELAKTKSEVHALHDLVAVLLAEIAANYPDSAARLHEIIESEKDAVYAANVTHENIHGTMSDILQQKSDFKERVFKLSRVVLGRIQATRT